MLKHKAMDKEVVDKIKELQTKKRRKEDQEGLKIHLPKLREHFKGKI